MTTYDSISYKKEIFGELYDGFAKDIETISSSYNEILNKIRSIVDDACIIWVGEFDPPVIRADGENVIEIHNYPSYYARKYIFQWCYDNDMFVIERKIILFYPMELTRCVLVTWR